MAKMRMSLMCGTPATIVAVAVAAILALPAGIAIAGAGETDIETLAGMTLSGDEYDPSMSNSPEWGTSDFSAYNIPAADFVCRSTSCEFQYQGLGYLYRTAGAADNGCFWAPLILPAGANFHGYRLFYYDNDAASAVGTLVTRYYGSTTPSYENLAVWDSDTAGTPGYASWYITVNHTITYDDPTDGEQGYAILVCPRANNSNLLRFKGVRVLYYLQVSPAPATATFGDVPTDHWAFRFVEALAASGITGGCGGGNFCPDDPLNRAQMAVFLSGALGLHFQW